MPANIIPIKAGHPVNTAANVRQWLSDHGYSIAKFCKVNNLDLDSAKSLIYNRSKGTYGKSHATAVALGMKVPTEEPTTKNTGGVGGVNTGNTASVCSSHPVDSPARGLREHLIPSDVSGRNSSSSGYQAASYL